MDPLIVLVDSHQFGGLLMRGEGVSDMNPWNGIP
jgi:hypothetical protein